MPEARRRAPRGQGAELRGEVLQAAMDLLAETDDEDAVSLRAVAARVGVSVPSIYLHFADKQALLDAVCARVFDALHVVMRSASDGAPHAFEALRAQGNAYVHFALANPEHYRIVLMQRRTDDLTVASGAFGHLVDSVQACLDDGVLVGEPVDLGLRLWAAAHGVASLLIATPSFPWPSDLEAFIDSTICMAGLGLAMQTRLGDLDDLPLPDLLARLAPPAPPPTP